jgi:hypothetical protein
MTIIKTAGINLPNDPTMIKKINDAMKEASSSYVRSEGERDFIKELFKELAKDTELPAAYLKKLSKLYHKQNVNEMVADNENIVELYEKIFGQLE